MTTSLSLAMSPIVLLTAVRRTCVRRVALVLALLVGVVSAASAETLLMPPRDMLMGTAAPPNGPGASGEVVWGVTTLPNGSSTYRFDFGDGTTVQTGTVTDRSFIAVNHVFPLAGTFTVTLQVTNGAATETATTTVRVFDGAQLVANGADQQLRGVNVNRTIQDGLRYLWVNQSNRTGNFPNGVMTDWSSAGDGQSISALVVLAFENQGYHVPNDDSAPSGLYEKYVVRRGLNYIIDQLRTLNLGPQPAGDPCLGFGTASDRCIGLWQNAQSEGYASSIAMLPLAGSNALDRHVAEISGTQNGGFVVGRTYKEVLQRLTNAVAWGQGESNEGRGGWGYNFNVTYLDGSTIGWNVLSLLDAAAASIAIPDFVKSEFTNFAIPAALDNDGTFDYRANNDPNNPGGIQRNMAKNGIGMQALFYAGHVGLGDLKVAAARNGISGRWLAPAPGDGYACPNGEFNKGCGYAMFNVFKALKLQGITTLPGVTRPAGPGNIPAGDWYADYVDWLIGNQATPTGLTSSSGGWTGASGKAPMYFSCCLGDTTVGSAALAELILSPVALIAPDPTLFSTVGLSPATALLAPFGQHTVTAAATSTGGAPVAGATVNFEVLTGPNQGKTGQSVTNQNGQAFFTYTDDGGPGRDTIQAFIGTLGSNVVEALWQVPDCDPQRLSVQLSAPIFPIDNGWRGVTINGAPGATVTQVCQDEPPNFENIAAWAIDADGIGTSNPSIRAQRSGTRTNPGNGRVYHLYFTAGACKGQVTVGVPLTSTGTAVDDGPRYDSVSGAACAVPQVPSIGTVPNVVGKTQTGAATDLAAAGLTLGAVSQVNSPTVPYGQVMSQLPAPGATVALGSSVAVTLSSGPSSVAVPNVVGQSQNNASAAISGVGLTPSIQQANDNIVPAGIVISQSPAANTQVPPGTPVVATVSLGKATAIVPNVVGLTLAGAVSAVGGAGLNFGNVNLVYSDSITDGVVITQSPVAQTVTAPGATVDFDVSLGKQPVPVPNIVGLTEPAATSSITGATLTVGNITQVHDGTVPNGQVISQTPSAGIMAQPGSAVSFEVSLGPVMVTVPDVTNQLLQAAQTAITSAGLTVGSVGQSNNPVVPAGAIALQSPAGNQSVPQGSAVNLTVSLGPTPVLVPNVTGQLQATATANIAAATLTVGAITTANSPTVPSGNVMGQNPLPNSSVLPGTPVSIVVSLGPVLVTVPTVVGQTQAAAQTAITNIGLFLQSISFTTNPAPAGQVISQSPAGGSSAVLGSPMTITVSLGSNSVTVPNVIGQTQAIAGATLATAGLNVGTVTTQTSSTVPAGTVMNQSPVGSTVASQGSSVNLLVSLGPVSATVPNVLGIPQTDAVNAILAAHLGAIVTFGTSPTVTTGNVISQSPASGTSVAEGSNVSIKVSTGLSAATVPDVIGLTQAAGGTAVTNAGLTVGNVTQESSAKAAGLIIGQTPSGGASAPGGSQVNLVVSTGPASGEPASLDLTLSSQVLGAGTGASITSSVLDGFSVPVLPTPGITYQVIAGPGATGTLPYVNGDQLLTSADTRGSYTLHGVVGATVVSDDVAFSVLNAAPTATNALKFIKLGAAEQTVGGKIADLLRAYQNLAPASDVTLAKTALSAALATVPITGKDAMERSTAVALENGFLPDIGTLSGAGYPLTAQDYAFGNVIGQLTAKLEEIEAFYNNLDPDATAGAANSVQQLTTLNSQLESLQTQLAAITPTPAGIVQFAPQLNRLLGHTIPEHLHAIGDRVVSIATQYPDPTNLPGGVARLENANDFFAALNARRQALTPGAFYTKTQPAFFGLLGLMAGASEEMELVNKVYGPIMNEVSEMMSVLIVNGLIQNYLNTASLGDLISGGSLSFQAPGIGGSSIEGYGIDPTSVAGSETWFIGPEAFDSVANLIKSFDPRNIHSIQDVWDFFNGIADAVNATADAYARAHTQPDSVAQGFCLLDDSGSCTSLYFDNGFPDVDSTRFPSPVIVLLHNTNNGSWASGVFDFVP